MSEEQLKKSLKHLESLPFVKEHQWTIALAVENEHKFVLVKDIAGAVIRKIPEADLWTLPLLDFNDQKGQLLRKTA